MEAARLNQVIQFQKRVKHIDEIGNHTNTWENYYKCHATIGNFSSRETDEGSQTLETEEFDCTVRSCNILKPLGGVDYRVVYDNAIWNITPPEKSSYHKTYVKFHCEKAHDGKKS